ncbi:MAG: T9SS type A sorting domain-containing protein, partial [Ferruginibacter sp.]|nr:T9SS type A sorting domain-containing protein [Ferruginibacter sp.]
YSNVPFYVSGAGGGNTDFYILLYETTNIIEVHVADNSGQSSSNNTKTLGIENSTGTEATTPTGRNFAAWNVAPASPEAWRFSPATPAFSYTWSGPASFSSTDQNPAITNVTAANAGIYSVVVTNSNTGCSSSPVATTAVVVNPRPTAVISGGATYCAGSVTATTLSISLTGTGPWNGTLSNGQVFSGSTSPISVVVPAVAATTMYTISSLTDANCTAQAADLTGTATVTVNPIPVTTTVTGIVNVCPYLGTGTPLTYTASAPGATSYNWIVPPTNVTIVSGQGTANLTLIFASGLSLQANKQLRVTASSGCGVTAQTIFYLLAQMPTTPNPISGPTNACPLLGGPTQGTYTITRAPGAASYNWTAQAGTATITHLYSGANDTSVTVLFAAGFTTSAITVQALNTCGASGIRSITVTRTAASTPGPIAGPTNACAFTAPGGTAATYSVTQVPGVSYTWTPVPGAIDLTGQSTNSISFTYPAGFTSGTISVTATNGCGTSAARNLSISRLNPATPSVIDVIQTAFCGAPGGRVFTYSLSSLPVNAASIQWTVPSSAGATIQTGQGTTSITVSYTDGSVNGTVTAQAVNNCAASTLRSTPVQLPACPPPGFAGKGSVTTVTSKSMEVKIFPNPTVNDFKLEVLTSGKEEINVRVLDGQGRLFKTFTLMPYQRIALGAELKAGAYLIEVRQGREVKTTKVIKF